MGQRLNYYSRYNRIKNQKDIDTLYHLIQGLNLDAIVNDDLIERVNSLKSLHIQEKLKYRMNHLQQGINIDDLSAKLNGYYNSNQTNQVPIGGYHHNQIQAQEFNRSQDSRRHASLDRSSSRNSNRRHRQPIIKKKTKRNSQFKANTSRDSIGSKGSKQSRRSKGKSSRNSKQRQNQEYSNYINEQIQAIKIYEQNCKDSNIIITQQQQFNYENKPQSPIHQIHIDDNQNQKINIQQYEGGENQGELKSQFYNSQADRKENNMDFYQHKHANFDDQLSDGLAELNKVDDIRNNSFQNQLTELNNQHNNQIQPESSQSQKLYRSGISVDDMTQTIQQNKNTMPETHHIYNINTYNININTGEEPQPGDEIGSDQQKKLKKKFNRNLFNKHHQDQEENQGAGRPTHSSIQDIDSSHTHFSFVFNKPNINNQNKLVNKDSINNIEQSSPTGKQRKPFKKMMMDKKLNPTILPPTSINEQVNLTTPTAAPAEPRKPINFKKANKAPNVLQPKAKQPTNEVITNEEAPVISPKKVNFKKALKKQVSENKEVQVRKQKQVKPPEEKRQLLQAFFDLN